MKILISGASIAGPVLAYWLRRHGFTPTVVERVPSLRKTGGHAVDLFRPAMQIVERMGVLDQVQARSTGTDRMTWSRPGARPLEVDVVRLMHAFSDRHAEIMREDLAEVFHAATRDVEYMFGDSITAICEDPRGVEVRFERAAPRRFDLVIGADGLHSNVRRLVFGDERNFSAHIGAYLAVVSLPNYRALHNHALVYSEVGRLAALYSARHMDDARAVFLWRSPQLDVHHRDIARQKQLLRAAFAGVGWEAPRILAELDRAPAFYFDAITQLRMDSWSRGRISLVGDAGYSPGPAVGGSTSLAVVGAYVLAGELAAADGDHVRGFAAYERAMIEYVRNSRLFALRAARQLVPTSRPGLWLQGGVLRLLSSLPTSLARAVISLGRDNVRLHDTIALEDYARAARTAVGSRSTPDGPDAHTRPSDDISAPHVISPRSPEASMFIAPRTDRSNS